MNTDTSGIADVWNSSASIRRRPWADLPAGGAGSRPAKLGNPGPAERGNGAGARGVIWRQ